MTNIFLTALQITALGMSLVFAAILLLWGMMSLLTAVTADRQPHSDSVGPASVMDNDLKARAAAVAVAIALAEQQTSLAHPLSDPPTAFVSAWQLGMRTRQMYQKGGSIRREARKTG
jgi:Na+-transporting methylmalonyl-CoA/oxaloacetate decarboxylase gamma subunit